MLRTCILLLVSLLLYSAIVPAQNIHIIAGTTSEGFSGDGGPSVDASISNPFVSRADAGGNLYIADYMNNRIRKINTAGTINTVAGNGSAAISGDGGPAMDAGIASPISVATDRTGNFYIATGNQIRKVNTTGIITTIAGNGTTTYSGDGGPATAAGFAGINDLTVDTSGNIYITDPGAGKIRKINTAGIISLFAGNPATGSGNDGIPATDAYLSTPWGITADNKGNIYFTESMFNRVRKINSAGIITSLMKADTAGFSGDGGPATNAQLSLSGSINNVATDTAGNIYIADVGNGRIRMISTTGIITTVAGGGWDGSGVPATDAHLGYPYCVSVDNAGNLYITDIAVIWKVSANSTGVQPVKSESQQLALSHNPTKGSFSLSLSSPTTLPAHIIITNIIGQPIKELTTTTNKETEITLNAPPGIYFVTSVTDEGRQTAKLIIE